MDSYLITCSFFQKQNYRFSYFYLRWFSYVEYTYLMPVAFMPIKYRNDVNHYRKESITIAMRPT